MNTDKNHDVGWIAREERKRGHVPESESVLIVQANHDWSVAHYDDPPGETAAHLARSTAAILDDERLWEPDWVDHQGWQYAQPEDSAPHELLRDAEGHDLFCLGDWVDGTPRLHAALRRRLETAERVCDSL